MKRNSFARLGNRLRDFLMWYFPLLLHSSSGIALKMKDRSQLRLYEQIFVEDVFCMNKVKNLLQKKDPVIFDIGANCGFFTVRVLDFWPNAKIYAFEPNGKLIQDIISTLELNEIGGKVVCVESAMGESDGKAIFYQNRSPISSSLVRDKVAQRRIVKQSYVDVTSLNRYVAEHAIREIDLLKIDVEGSERDVLEGATNVLGKVFLLIIEVHPPFATVKEIQDIVKVHGLARAHDLERPGGKGNDLVFVNENRG